MKSTQYTVTTTAVKVYDKTNASERIYVRATGSDIYLGGSDVSTTNGLKLDANSVIEIFVDGAEKSVNEALIADGYAWGYMGETKIKDFAALEAKRKESSK